MFDKTKLGGVCRSNLDLEGKVLIYIYIYIIHVIIKTKLHHLRPQNSGRQKETEGRQGGHNDQQRETSRDKRKQKGNKANTVTNKKGDKLRPETKGDRRETRKCCMASGEGPAVTERADAS